MKKTMIYAAVLLGLCSCNQAKIFSGDYSYKTTGMVTLVPNDTTSIEHEIKHIGTLSVVDLKSSDKDSILLIFNELGGSLTTVRAKVDDDSVWLTPYTKTISLQDGLLTVDGEVTVMGRGVRYDDIIMLDEVYDGVIVSDTTNIKIHGEHISTVANRN